MIQFPKQVRLAKCQPFLKVSVFSTLGATLKGIRNRTLTQYSLFKRVYVDVFYLFFWKTTTMVIIF